MRTMLALAVLGTTAVTVLSAQSDPAGRPSDSMTRAFPADGRITMDLSAGEYHVIGTGEQAIRLTWSVRDRDDLSRVRRDVAIRGRQAEIEIDGPGGNNNGSHFEVTIEVPSRSDLEIDLSAGELGIRGITGNKDVTLQAGEMSIEVGRANDYRRVEASVWAGEVKGEPFGINKGGLFRSVDWEGPGQYTLRAHLKAGEIRLR